MTPFNETASSTHAVRVDPWPTEFPLLVLVALVSLAIWGLLAISIIGLVYVLLFGVVFFVAHIALITYIRGSAVQLSPVQFPELHQRVELLAARAGLSPVPEAYVLQADGSLNAFATKFLRAHMVVLFTDLLDACGDDEAARDMIIGHELGHVRAGHLRWHWFLVPGLLVPFLGAAYSRAREFTCDRWGAALAGSSSGAVRGLVLLAAGRRLAPRVNIEAYVAQQASLDTGWMTIGRWLSAYPPLSARVEAIQPSTGPQPRSARGPIRAVAILAAFIAIPTCLALGLIAATKPLFSALAQLRKDVPVSAGAEATGDEAREAQCHRDIDQFESLLADEVVAGRTVPADYDGFVALWEKTWPARSVPTDCYASSRPYGYVLFDAESVTFTSVGADTEPDTADDIERLVGPAAHD